MSLHTHDPLKLADVDQFTRVRLNGAVDPATAPALTAHLGSLPVGIDVEVDLSQVRFMSAAGLTLLRTLRQQLARDGARLYLIGVSAAVHRLLVLVGLREVFLEAPAGPAPAPVEPQTVLVDRLYPAWPAARSTVAFSPHRTGPSRVVTCRAAHARRQEDLDSHSVFLVRGPLPALDEGVSGDLRFSPREAGDDGVD